MCCISPEAKVLAKRLPPSVWPVKDAAVVVAAPPRPRPKAEVCCGAVAVRTEPNDKPATPGAAKGVEVVREKGVAEAVGLLKAKLKPVAAPVAAGAPERK